MGTYPFHVSFQSCLDYTHRHDHILLQFPPAPQLLLYYTHSANILLDTNWRAKLTDFGVARAVDSSSSMAVTQTIVGTRVYMAPEYCTGVVSPAADVYSYGVVSKRTKTTENYFPQGRIKHILLYRRAALFR